MFIARKVAMRNLEEVINLDSRSVITMIVA